MTENVKKVFIRTFGCQMNEYDSDKMLDILGVAEPVELTQDPALADVILFNTCSVREKAQSKVFSDLGRVKALKKANPNLVIGVGGLCGQSGRRHHRQTCALRRCGVWPSNPSPAA